MASQAPSLAVANVEGVLKSNGWIVIVNPAGPHHVAMRMGSLIATKTSKGVAVRIQDLESERVATGSILRLSWDGVGFGGA
jgi:hypothetical protein